jgi:hypothetical protein
MIIIVCTERRFIDWGNKESDQEAKLRRLSLLEPPK